MLILGDPRLAPTWREGLVIFNFTSMVEGLDRLNIIPPPIERADDYTFDMYYANWLVNDPNGFDSLVRLIYLLYLGYDVYLCASEYYYTENINESLLKFIQARYGYIGNVIHTMEDLNYVKEGEFSLGGLANLDMDKERYCSIAMQNILKYGSDNGFYSFIMGEGNGYMKSVQAAKDNAAKKFADEVKDNDKFMGF